MPAPRDSLSATAPPARGSQLRIVFVTQEDPFYLPCFFDEFYRIAAKRTRLADAHGATVELAGIMIQRPLGNRTKSGLLKRMWRLYGSFGLARQVLRYAYRRGAPWHHGVAEQASRAGVPVLGLRNANGSKFVSFVKQNDIDLVVSVSAAQIFKTQILHAPRLGCINLHNAPLPRYRGMLPNFWQMYHDEPYSVLTIHSMVEDLDKGNVLLQRSTRIEEGMSLENLIRRTKTRSARALWNVLDGFAHATLSPEPLPTDGGSYFSWPTRAEAREFRRRGKRLL
jgi:methionyl-tRNA formyltransferase